MEKNSTKNRKDIVSEIFWLHRRMAGTGGIQ
mgnify:CR=1 FL=1